MKFASLGSGSQGNGLVIEYQSTCVLVDCGFTLKATEERLARLGKTPADLTALLVTHEHTDHIRGIGPLARKYNLPTYMTHGTWAAGKAGEIDDVRLICSHQAFELGELQVQPVAVPHDAREPCQFVVAAANKRLGILTDLGSITPHVVEAYQGCDALLLECNHDPVMLAKGPYAAALKRRVGSQYGHLSNSQAADFVERVYSEQLQHLVISHVSETNNTPELARRALESVLGIESTESPEWIEVADQQQGFQWRVIN